MSESRIYLRRLALGLRASCLIGLVCITAARSTTPDHPSSFASQEEVAAPKRSVGKRTDVEIGMNLGAGGNSYAGSQYPFLDRFKTSGTWGPQGVSDGTTVPLDEHGWPTALPAGATMLYNLINLDPVALPTTDRYILTYEGTADIRLGAESRIISSTPGRIVFDFAYEGNIASLQILSISATDPIHDIQVVREDQQALLAGGAVFNPAFLDKASDWSILRFMDWGGTNFSQLVDWNDRPKATDSSWGQHVPIEIMVRLANDAQADMWYNVPAHANDDFVRQALTYIRDHLDPDLTLHLEYSNEVWNWGFEQAHYAQTMGRQLNASRPADWQGAHGNTEFGSLQYYGYRSAQIAAMTDEVFGAQSDARVENVLGTQTVYHGLENYTLEGVRFANLGQVGDLFEEYTIATYFGDALSGHTDADRAIVLGWARSGSAGLNAAFQQLATGGLLSNNDSLDAFRSHLTYQAGIARQHGLDLVAYEGGLHLYATNYPAADQATIVDFMQRLVNDPRMGTLYTQMATDFAAAGGSELVAFNDIGQVSRFGAWGMLESSYQNSSVRYNALRKVASAGR